MLNFIGDWSWSWHEAARDTAAWWWWFVETLVSFIPPLSSSSSPPLPSPVPSPQPLPTLAPSPGASLVLSLCPGGADDAWCRVLARVMQPVGPAVSGLYASFAADGVGHLVLWTLLVAYLVFVAVTLAREHRKRREERPRSSSTLASRAPVTMAKAASTTAGASASPIATFAPPEGTRPAVPCVGAREVPPAAHLHAPPDPGTTSCKQPISDGSGGDSEEDDDSENDGGGAAERCGETTKETSSPEHRAVPEAGDGNAGSKPTKRKAVEGGRTKDNSKKKKKKKKAREESDELRQKKKKSKKREKVEVPVPDPGREQTVRVKTKKTKKSQRMPRDKDGNDKASGLRGVVVQSLLRFPYLIAGRKHVYDEKRLVMLQTLWRGRLVRRQYAVHRKILLLLDSPGCPEFADRMLQ